MMQNTLLGTIRKARAVVMKNIKPVDAYFLSKSLQPISTKYGFDRGLPIDRIYIEKFLDENKKLIKGRCLEVVDNTYTKKFGGKKVTRPEVIDNDKKSKTATIIADLRDMGVVQSNSFDCVLITHTFGMIYDFEKAIKECERILKPGGYLLVTMSCFSPLFTNDDMNFWRFTPASAKKAFGKYFTDLKVSTLGNCLTGYSFWVGLAAEELDKKALEFNDPRFPLIVTVKARKGKTLRT
jgi:SAM-dependent methyltransferase